MKKKWIPYIVGIFLGLCFAAARDILYGIIGGLIAWYVMSLLFKSSSNSSNSAIGSDQEAAGPKCAYCGRQLTEKSMRDGAVVETPDGPRFYCSRMHKVNDGYGGQGY